MPVQVIRSGLHWAVQYSADLPERLFDEPLELSSHADKKNKAPNKNEITNDFLNSESPVNTRCVANKRSVIELKN